MRSKNLISTGDFHDLYYKVRATGLRFVVERLLQTKKGRIKSTWQYTDIPLTNWRTVPRIVSRQNYLITGNYDTDLSEYVYLKYLRGKKNRRAVSPGCGTGTNEIKFAKFDCFRLIEAFDTSENAIAEASKKARNSGIRNIKFTVEDVNNFDFGFSRYDMILLHGSLHHFEDIENLLIGMRDSLTPEGILVVHEYIGPNRFQWTDEQLEVANRLLGQIPVEYRKKWNSKIVKKRQHRPGILRMVLYDPSEAVNSEYILPLLQKHFKSLEIKNLGGNLLRLILKDIAHNFLGDDDDTIGLIDHLFAEEDKFLSGHQSDFIFGVFAKVND